MVRSIGLSLGSSGCVMKGPRAKKLFFKKLRQKREDKRTGNETVTSSSSRVRSSVRSRNVSRSRTQSLSLQKHSSSSMRMPRRSIRSRANSPPSARQSVRVRSRRKVSLPSQASVTLKTKMLALKKKKPQCQVKRTQYYQFDQDCDISKSFRWVQINNEGEEEVYICHSCHLNVKSNFESELQNWEDCDLCSIKLKPL